MRWSVPQSHPLRRMFHGLVEQVFMTELGICEPELTDYLSGMLSEFVHMDWIYRMRSLDGRRLRELSEIEAEAYLGPDVDELTRKRIIYRYMGDLTLFWAGVYPEQLRPRRGPDRLHAYVVQGKRSYGIASELTPAEAQPPGRLLRQLSEEFEYCVYGLRQVRSQWEHLGRPESGN